MFFVVSQLLFIDCFVIFFLFVAVCWFLYRDFKEKEKKKKIVDFHFIPFQSMECRCLKQKNKWFDLNFQLSLYWTRRERKQAITDKDMKACGGEISDFQLKMTDFMNPIHSKGYYWTHFHKGYVILDFIFIFQICITSTSFLIFISFPRLHITGHSVYSMLLLFIYVIEMYLLHGYFSALFFCFCFSILFDVNCTWFRYSFGTFSRCGSRLDFMDVILFENRLLVSGEFSAAQIETKNHHTRIIITHIARTKRK